MLELLKRSKNRHYQFYDDYSVYEERCKKQDFTGYTMVFDDNIEVIQDIEDKQNEPEPMNEDEDQENRI